MTPLCVIGLGTVIASHDNGRIRVLITLLTYPRFRFVRLASHATFCTSAMTSFWRWSWSLCLAQLTHCLWCDLQAHADCHCPLPASMSSSRDVVSPFQP